MNSQGAIKTLRDALSYYAAGNHIQHDALGVATQPYVEPGHRAADALAATASIERPAHEEIIREGNSLVCTACGTTTEIAQPVRVALSDARIFELHKRFEIGDKNSNNWGFAWHDFARAILAAQADAPSITQPLIAEAARDDVDLLEALEIGLECAQEVAADTHLKLAGYKPDKHAAADADVVKIEKAIAAVKRDDVAVDALRYRNAIALADNAETLYAAVLNNAPDHAAIGREFDAAIAASKVAQ